MRVRRIAVLIDGGGFLRRLPKLVEPQFRTTPQQIAEMANLLCKRHVLQLAGSAANSDDDDRWLDHVYRLYYYDAIPYVGTSHHPVLNRRIEFSKTEIADFRRALFAELRHKRKFALRLGKVMKGDDWRLSARLTR